MPRSPLAKSCSALVATVAVLALSVAPAAASSTPSVTVFTNANVVHPTGISRGPDGNMWFVDESTDRVGRITPSGTITTFTNANVDQPTAIVTGGDGALWFTSLGNHRIGRITTAGAITTFSDPGLANPRDLVLGSDGNVWFTSGFAGVHDGVGRITQAGTITMFTAPSLVSLNGIASGSDGNLWVTSSHNNTIVRVTTGGVATPFNNVLITSLPMRITAGPDSALWFLLGGDRVGRITTAGVISVFVDPAGGGADDGLTGIAVGPDNNLWYANFSANRLIRVTTSGEFTQFGGPHVSVPRGVVNGIDGNLWFTNWGGSGSIARMTPPGPENHRSDMTIKHTPTDSGYFGGAVYSSGGGGQTRNADAHHSTTVTAFARVRNLGPSAATFTFQGSASTTGFTTHYGVNNGSGTFTDITSQVRHGTYQVANLAPGAAKAIKVTVTVGSSVAVGTVHPVLVTATSSSGVSQSDTVRLNVHVVA